MVPNFYAKLFSYFHYKISILNCWATQVIAVLSGIHLFASCIIYLFFSPLSMERVLRKLGQKKAKSGKYTMVVDPMNVGNLLSPMLSALYREKFYILLFNHHRFIFVILLLLS